MILRRALYVLPLFGVLLGALPGAALADSWRHGPGHGHHDRGDWDHGRHHRHHGPPPRAYYAPPPRVVYMAPPPPRVVYVQPAPPPVYYQPAPSLSFIFPLR